jgi:hypothetical protein
MSAKSNSGMSGGDPKLYAKSLTRVVIPSQAMDVFQPISAVYDVGTAWFENDMFTV